MERSRIIDAGFFYGTTPEIMLRAAELRKNMTRAEKILWEKLRRKGMINLTFRRQHPINMFIADFYCHKVKLVVEIDGSIHDIDEFRIRDMGREDEFEKYGIKTIRFSNEDIYHRLNSVLEKIKTDCERRLNDT